jgi:hypothetical protein
MPDRRPRRLAPAVLSVLVAGAMASATSDAGVRAVSSARAAPHGLRLTLSAPGHISIETFELTVSFKGKRPALPARLRLLPQRLGRLPASVRILYATRTIRKKRSTTYLLAQVAVNAVTKQAPAQARAAGPGSEPAEGQLLGGGGKGMRLSDDATLALFYGAPVGVLAVLRQEERDYEDEADAQSKAVLTAQADLATKAAAKATLAALSAVTDPNGDGKLDPGLDTGNYDDGHAFGWKVDTKAEELNVWNDLTKATTLGDFIATLENDLGADINGNGVLDEPGTTSGGEQIGTVVGAPVVGGYPAG